MFLEEHTRRNQFRKAVPGLGLESSQEYCQSTDDAMCNYLTKHHRIIDVRASQWLRNPLVTEAMKKVEELVGFEEKPIKGAMCCRNMRKWKLDLQLKTIYLQDHDGLEHHVNHQGVISEQMASTPLVAELVHLKGCDHQTTEQYGVVTEDMSRINGVLLDRATFFIPVESHDFFTYFDFALLTLHVIHLQLAPTSIMTVAKEGLDFIFGHGLDRNKIQEGIDNVVELVRETMENMDSLPMELSCLPQPATATQPNKSVNLHWIQHNMDNKSYPCTCPNDKGRIVFANRECKCLPSPWVFDFINDCEGPRLQMKCIYTGQVGSVSLTSFDINVEQKETAPSNFDYLALTHGAGCWHDINLGKYVPFYSLINFHVFIDSKWNDPHLQERVEFLDQVWQARQSNPMISNGLNLALVPEQ